jgi:hypothetical protein
MGVWLGSAFLGLAAYWTATALGVTAWRHWPPGDAEDIGMFVFLGLVLIVRAVRR